jgi:hypothetical protein
VSRTPSRPAEHGARPGPSLAVYLGPRWLIAALPAPAFAGTLGANLQLVPAFALDLSALLGTFAESELASYRTRGSLTGGLLLGCAQLEVGRASLQGCLGGGAADCRVDSTRGDGVSSSANLLWAFTALRIGLRWPNDGVVSARFSAQVHLNLVRPGLRLEDRSEQRVPARVGASLGIDLLFKLF